MSGDPFPGRCHHCGTPLMDDVESCGRGPDQCRTDLARLRDLTAGTCRRILAAARRLGLVE